MRILGIDPGLAKVGWGVVKCEKVALNCLDSGRILTSKEEKLSSRIASIYREITHIITSYQPDIVCIEKLFFGGNITSGIFVAHARGAILLAAEHLYCNIVEYSPLEMKKELVGSGKADKKEVKEAVKRALRLDGWPSTPDAADALGLAIVYAKRNGLQSWSG